MPSHRAHKAALSALTLTLTLGAAYLQAVGVSHFIAPSLSPSSRRRLDAVVRPNATTAAEYQALEHQTSARRVLERNPFDSTRGSLLPHPSPTGEPNAGPGSGDPYAAPPCPGAIVVATAAGKNVNDSFALLAGGDGRRGAAPGVVRRQGEEFQGKRVWLVAWDRVWLSGPGSLCQADLFSTPPAEAPATESRPAPWVEGPGARVRQLGPGSFEIGRSTLDGLLDKRDELMRTVRLGPETVGGKVVGLRLQTIRPDSPLANIGLETGDRLETINGVDVSDPVKLLEAYARLRVAERFRVTLTRRGRPTTLEYAIK
jgi:hypothetical protein